MVFPPLYIISTLFGPMFDKVSRAYCRPVSPTVTTSTMDAEPMIMPSIVSRKRTLEAWKLSSASRSVSLNISEVLADRSVPSKVL